MSLGQKSFFISLTGHLLGATLIVFTFPTRPVAHKPMFVFLGSLLESRDFAGLDAGPVKPSNKSPQDRIPVQATGSAFYPTDRALLKPAFSKTIPEGERGFLKSTFMEQAPPVQEDAKPPTLEELGISPRPPQRQPLRLYY